MSQEYVISIAKKEHAIIKYIKEYLSYKNIDYSLSYDRIKSTFRFNSTVKNYNIVAELTAEILIFFYKYKVLEKELDKFSIKNSCFYAYIGALLSVDSEQEKIQLMEQIEQLGNIISVDGVYNFCCEKINENWKSLSQLAYKLYSQCKCDDDAFELTNFILGVDGESDNESIIVIDNNASIKLIKDKQHIPIISFFDKESFNVIVTLLSHRPTNIIILNPTKIEPEIMRAIHYLGEQ